MSPPSTRAGFVDEPADFSVILGGPLYQLYLRFGLLKPPLNLMRRRIVGSVLIVWLPLLLLSIVAGRSIAGVEVPFLYDIEGHVRFLLALPLLIAAEIVVHTRIRPVVTQFVERGIVVAEDLPRFDAAIASVMRLRNSMAVEIGLIVFVYTVGHWGWREQVALPQATWYATPGASGVELTLAGYWYAFVSLPIFRFVLLRWYWRLCLWFLFLWRVSRLNLRLIPTHPDRAGGLSFVGNSAFAFEPILFAQGAVLAGILASRIFYRGDELMSFKVEIAGLVGLFVLLILGPLLMFTPQLVTSRRLGLRDYGLLASRHAQEFDDKWIRGGAVATESLVGHPDISSWADLDSGYENVQKLRPVPFGLDAITRLVFVTAAPLLPLTLTVVPLEELVERLIKVIL